MIRLMIRVGCHKFMRETVQEIKRTRTALPFRRFNMQDTHQKYCPFFAALSMATASLLATPAVAQSDPDSAAAGRALLTQYVELKNEKNASQLGDIYSESYIENTGRATIC